MKTIIISFITLFAVSCVQSQDAKEQNTKSKKDVVIPVADKGSPSPNEAVATFAEGCFWHSEIVFQSLVGVRDAVSGYSGGNVADPDYETVCSGSTGHTEAVQVYYDPSKITYEALVKAFFASMDPTTLNKQGNDEGTQYRSAAFYRNDSEKKIIENEIKNIEDSKKYSSKVVTEVVPFEKFYPAEEYHQEYIVNHPNNGYVKNVSIPDYVEFRESFKGNFKN